MATNLVATISRFITPDAVTKIALALGLDRNAVEQAIGAGIPSILGGLVSLVSTPDGAQRLSNVLAQQSPSTLEEAKNSFGGTDQNVVADHGMGVLSTLLGSGTAKSIAAAVGDYAGVRGGAGKSLLGMLAPVVLGVLGQQQRASGLDAHGLANLLHNQKDSIADALPSGFAQQLSGTGILESLGDSWRSGAAATAAAAKRAGISAGSSYSGAQPAYAVAPGGTSPGASNWPLWLVALAAVGGLLWYLTSGHQPEQLAETSAPIEEGRAVAPSQASVSELTQQVSTSITGLRSTLQGMTDSASAEAALPRLRTAADNLDKLAEMTGRLPPAVKRTVTSQVTAVMPTINQQIERVLSDPAIAGVARPVIETVRAKLSSLAGA